MGNPKNVDQGMNIYTYTIVLKEVKLRIQAEILADNAEQALKMCKDRFKIAMLNFCGVESDTIPDLWAAANIVNFNSYSGPTVLEFEWDTTDKNLDKQDIIKLFEQLNQAAQEKTQLSRLRKRITLTEQTRPLDVQYIMGLKEALKIMEQ